MPNERSREQTLEAQTVVTKARALAAAGQFAAVVEFLGTRERGELVGSPTLALLYGIAQAGRGRHEQGLEWLEHARSQSPQHGELVLEGHGLNPRGPIAVVR